MVSKDLPPPIVTVILFILFYKTTRALSFSTKTQKLHALLHVRPAQGWGFVSCCPGSAQWRAGFWPRGTVG